MYIIRLWTITVFEVLNSHEIKTALFVNWRASDSNSLIWFESLLKMENGRTNVKIVKTQKERYKIAVENLSYR